MVVFVMSRRFIVRSQCLVGDANFDVNRTPLTIETEILKRAKHKYDKINEAAEMRKKAKSNKSGKGYGKQKGTSSSWHGKRAHDNGYGSWDKNSSKRGKR